MTLRRIGKVLVFSLFGALLGVFLAQMLGANGPIANLILIGPPTLIGIVLSLLAFDKAGDFRNRNGVIAALTIIITFVIGLFLSGLIIIFSSTDL